MDFLSVQNLNAIYDTDKGHIKAVQDVSFSMSPGESVGIVGESACGKSTLGLALIRTIPGGRIQSGTIMFDGKSLLDLPNEEFDSDYRWKQISMIFQGAMNSLDPVYTISHQFVDVLKQHQSNDKNVVKSLLSQVGLDESILSKYPHELSGGMKQRVIIAMALLLKPKLVIADEPTTALDDLAVISQICEKIGIMYAGQMVEFGTSQQILTNPKHPYTQALIKSIPRLHDTQKPQFIPGSPPSLLNPKQGCRFAPRCPHVMDKCNQDTIPTKTETGYVQCWLYE
ncbi:MAG: ABC transporter ATP-binding protein [Nitrososphaeria archaeon]|nr:ABC transporter ATP-binding protein [Nitrososphaeria archaeon]